MRCTVGQTQLTFDTLPDDALLYVFDFYLSFQTEAWHTLVHVCRRWRNLVFGSPRRLNLRILCTNETPVREKLDVWPSLPILIVGNFSPIADLDNIKAALEHHDRVCHIHFFFNRCGFGDLVGLLEEPFPILTNLFLKSYRSARLFDQIDPNPSKFLGGSSHLRSLTLSEIRFPESQKILLCTPNLVTLRLHQIDYYLPNDVVTVVSALTRLEQLQVYFRQYHPEWENRRLPLPTRTVLPSLTLLNVTGVIEDVEDFMARIDAPLLDHLYIRFSCSSDRDIVDTRQLLWFISRIPKLQAPSEAHIGFITDNFNVSIKFSWPAQISSVVKLGIYSLEPELTIPDLAQFCRSPLFPLPTLERLYIGRRQSSPQPHRDNTRWLELLQSFTAVKNLYLTKELALCIAPTLQQLVGDRDRAAEVLPTLQNIFIEELRPSDPVHEAIAQFAATRQLSGHSIAISHWDGTQGMGRE